LTTSRACATTSDHCPTYLEFRRLIPAFADSLASQAPINFPQNLFEDSMPNRVDQGDSEAAPTANPKTRRDALSLLASAGALGFPRRSPLIAIHDPVFAAIEQHEAAWAALGLLCSTIDEVAAAQKGHEVAETDRTAYARASAVADQTFDELLTTPPKTVEGLRAAICYIIELDDACLSEVARPFLLNVLNSRPLAIEQ
jgi:hypothetical protein